jgi:hypothetical protein
MRDLVSEWRQEGRLFVWRYPELRQKWRGWHFTADPVGCRSVRNLLDRMLGGEACHRSLRTEPVTDAILRVPNFGDKTVGAFRKLRIEYEPAFQDLRILPSGEALSMTVGERRLRKVAAAFAAMEVGGGDFEIATSDSRKSEPWMFWWMPRDDHKHRN